MPQPAKTPTEHRQAITRVLRAIAAEPDVCDLVLDNFDCAVKASRAEGYGHCAEQVLTMANSLGHGTT